MTRRNLSFYITVFVLLASLLLPVYLFVSLSRPGTESAPPVPPLSITPPVTIQSNGQIPANYYTPPVFVDDSYREIHFDGEMRIMIDIIDHESFHTDRIDGIDKTTKMIQKP